MIVHKLKSVFITVFTLFLLPINHYLLNSIDIQHLKFMSSFLLPISYQLIGTPFNYQKYFKLSVLKSIAI